MPDALSASQFRKTALLFAAGVSIALVVWVLELVGAFVGRLVGGKFGRG